MFTGAGLDSDKRYMNYELHRLKECRQNPPDVNEGITDIHWAQIKAMPRQPRSPDSNTKLNLASSRWKYIWTVLFGNEEAPQPCR